MILVGAMVSRCQVCSGALYCPGSDSPKVISDMPNEYGQLPKDARSWELMIGYLYAKYLKELGRL